MENWELHCFLKKRQKPDHFKLMNSHCNDLGLIFISDPGRDKGLKISISRVCILTRLGAESSPWKFSCPDTECFYYVSCMLPECSDFKNTVIPCSYYESFYFVAHNDHNTNFVICVAIFCTPLNFHQWIIYLTSSIVSIPDIYSLIPDAVINYFIGTAITL